LYLALALLTVAFGLFFNTWWPILLLIPTLMVVQHFIIAREEGYLRHRFGVEYDAYTRRVRRWLWTRRRIRWKEPQSELSGWPSRGAGDRPLL